MKIYSLKKKKLSPVLLFGKPYYPYWRPGGGAIAFLDEAEGLCIAEKGGRKKILVSPADIKNLLGADYADRKISLSSPGWSPDGSRIYFQVLVDSREANARSQVWVYNFEEEKIFRTAFNFEQATEFHKKKPKPER